MPKKKNKQNVFPMQKNEIPPAAVIDDFFDKMITNEIPPVSDSGMASMITSVINSVRFLSNLVVENRVRNSEQMTDEDVYKIYRKSFATVAECMDELESSSN